MDIQKKIIRAVNELYEKDSDLLSREFNMHERTITHRLAMYLEPHFCEEGYSVDVEYNRMQDELYDGESDDIGNIIGKRLQLDKSEEGSSFVYPDIIVHKRLTNDNLVEIEVKMAWKNRHKSFDYKKINEYMGQLKYKHGVYIELSDTPENCLIEYGPFEIERNISKEQYE